MLCDYFRNFRLWSFDIFCGFDCSAHDNTLHGTIPLQSLPETLDNQQSFPSSSHNQQRYGTDQNTIYEHHGQLGQMQYIDMGQTNDDFEEVMPMVSMEDNNFVDMSSIDMGDLICEPVNLDPNALQG